MTPELTPSFLLEHLQSLYLKQSQQVSETSVENTAKKKILVAYSGGLDSHVLLHLLSRISGEEFDLRSVYVNHGLQVQAADWAKHCEQICQELGVPFSIDELQLCVPMGESVEEYARNARYQALFSNLQQNEALLTAHHQNDQAETLLLQLFRGAGVQGLAAMPQSIKVNKYGSSFLHLRPLLNFSRSSLEAYAKEYDLNYVGDPSNQDTTFDRNYLRNEIMPLLRKRWLGIDKTISRSAEIQAETKQLLDEMAEQQIASVISKETLNSYDDNPLALPPLLIPNFLLHSEVQQRLLLRYWITQQGFPSPSEKKLQHVFSDMIESDADKQPLIRWSGAELRRYKKQLYIMSPLTEHDTNQVLTWNPKDSLTIETLGLVLESELIAHKGKHASVRFRQGGETIEIPKRGNISLKNLFQENHIPPWMRSRLPLIYIGEKLIKIVGLENYKTPPHF